MFVLGVESPGMSDNLLSRFLRYVRVDTQSDENSTTFPSTPGQLVLLEMLKQELSELGAADVQMTKHGYVIASIPANTRKARVPTVAFLAHVDTAPDCSGKGVKPIVHRKYDGGVIKFPDNSGMTLDPATSPELRTAVGKDIVTASGTTLLGSDDKSGVAVVMTLVERLLQEKKRKHGLIRVCFTPDEEIGRGVDKLDLRMLGADVAYTLDGGAPGEICWETFSGDAAEVIIDGITTHPMEARAKGMVNAIYLAGKLLAALPRERCAPETTDGRDGFIHPTKCRGPNRAGDREIYPARFRSNGVELRRAKCCRAFAEGYKLRSLGRASAARYANNIATWLTGYARTCARLSWLARLSQRQDLNPMTMSSVAARMAPALLSWACQLPTCFAVSTTLMGRWNGSRCRIWSQL